MELAVSLAQESLFKLAKKLLSIFHHSAKIIAQEMVIVLTSLNVPALKMNNVLNMVMTPQNGLNHVETTLPSPPVTIKLELVLAIKDLLVSIASSMMEVLLLRLPLV